ncbi:MAG: mechanosensitive ion channel family protein [Chloroflexota bacterium]
MENVARFLQSIVTHDYFRRAILIVITWALAWVLVRYLSRWIEAFDRRFAGVEINTRELGTLDRLLDYLVISVASVITVYIMGWTDALYSLLTAAGVIGIIVGFAVKDVAANFISGIFILVDQSFVVGDAIDVGVYSGTVHEISLRSTTITTWDGTVVTIPNSTMATDPVINYSINPTRRIDVTFSIAYEEDIENALQAVRSVIEAEQRRAPDVAITVYVSDVREYAIDIRALFHAPNAVWFDVLTEFRPKVLAEFRKRDVELAVPVNRTVYLGKLPQLLEKGNLGD